MNRFTCSILVLSFLILPSCAPKPPETAHLIYEVPKTLNPNCGPNILCIDYEGVGRYGDQCTPVDFSFDNSAWMNVSVATQLIYPGNQVNLELVQYGLGSI